MATVPQSSEAQAVASREYALRKKFTSKRTRSLALTAIFALLCPPLLVMGYWTFSICAVFISLIGLSNYFAANGHLHRLQKREMHRRQLAWNFSKLEPGNPTGRSSHDPDQNGLPTPIR